MKASNHFFFVLTAAHKAVHTDQYETKALWWIPNVFVRYNVLNKWLK